MLSDRELEAFVRDGFFAKKAVLSKDECERALDATWEVLAEQGITPDPATWKKAHSRRGVVKLRDDISDNGTIHDVVAGCSGVQDVVSDLMGPDFVNCNVRGVYPTVPIPRRKSRPYEPHIEVHPCQVVVMYYLNDVTTKNGGLLVWPGSHRDVYLSHSKRFDFCARQEFLQHFERYSVKAPVELTGSAGDALFFHHRLLHSGSNNFGKTIRFGILNDFIPADFEATRDVPPTPGNMWNYWSDRVQQVASGLEDHGPLTQPPADIARSLMINALHTVRGLRGKPRTDYAEILLKDPSKAADA
jgi:hypothetical protein